MDYMTLKRGCRKVGRDPRRINYYCAGGYSRRCEDGYNLVDPEKTRRKPVDMRTKQGKELKHE